MEKLHTITTLQELQQLKDSLADFKYLSFDTETNGVNKDATIIGFSVSPDEETGYYVVLKAWKNNKFEDFDTLLGAKDFLEYLKDFNLIMHNAVFDCWMVENNFGVQLMDNVHTDTMILAHLVDENRKVGLKELAHSIFGESARKEQTAMKESVVANGGMLTKKCYELYKADYKLIAKYGAKDTILTMKIFQALVPQLYEQGLDKFFYEDESMPLLRGPTYDLNTTGMRVDAAALSLLKRQLETECLEMEAFINQEISYFVSEKYPGTTKNNTFNINAPKQLAWLLFSKLENEFNTLTKSGKLVCKSLTRKLPYTSKAKYELIHALIDNKGYHYEEAKFNAKTGKMGRPKKIADWWHYVAVDKTALGRLSKKYKWVDTLLKHSKSKKLLNTYVRGIQERTQYSIIRCSYLQHGTTSGRYSCKNPNFQNLPRDDKRIKSCIVARPGKVFVGADHSQLEPRVFC